MLIKSPNYAYALSLSEKSVCFVDLKLLKLIELYDSNQTMPLKVIAKSLNVDNNNVEQLIKKFEYLKKHEFIGDSVPTHEIFKDLEPVEIEENFYNTPEIVFEITESCNMKCKYCVYGDLYINNKDRQKRRLSSKLIVGCIKQIFSRRNKTNNRIQIGFYGGEPLICFSEIKQAVDDIISMFPKYDIEWLITTNGTLLTDAIVDFLIKMNFRVLISIDGNRKHNANRKMLNGEDSYDGVIQNIKRIREKSTVFFDSRVQFSAVLTSSNDSDSVRDFFLTEFGKSPYISDLTTIGVNEVTSFEKLRNKHADVKDFDNDPVEIGNKLIPFLQRITYNYLFGYKNSLFHQDIEGSDKRVIRHTGTCVPFQKKIFITADGVIKPCEKIPNGLNLGRFFNDKFEISFEDIASMYNRIYNKIWDTCILCGNFYTCNFCIFYINDILKDTSPKCQKKLNREETATQFGKYFGILENNPLLYPLCINVKYE